MIRGDRVKLYPAMMSEDWVYAFKLARRDNPELTEDQMSREWLKTGFVAFVGYADEMRAGFVFSKRYADGVTLDGYVDNDVVPSRCAQYSFEAARLMLEFLHRYSASVYTIFRPSRRLEKLVRLLGMEPWSIRGGETPVWMIYKSTKELIGV
jgi:hypothetical protein